MKLFGINPAFCDNKKSLVLSKKEIIYMRDKFLFTKWIFVNEDSC